LSLYLTILIFSTEFSNSVSIASLSIEENVFATVGYFGVTKKNSPLDLSSDRTKQATIVASSAPDFEL